jgi:hypothetical protein
MDGTLPIVVLVSVGLLVNLLLEGSLVSLFLRRLNSGRPMAASRKDLTRL